MKEIKVCSMINFVIMIRNMLVFAFVQCQAEWEAMFSPQSSWHSKYFIFKSPSNLIVNVTNRKDIVYYSFLFKKNLLQHQFPRHGQPVGLTDVLLQSS